jgi:hypothetical protein
MTLGSGFSAQHDFMDHDSHIDCSRVRSFMTDDVVADLMTRPEWVLGDAADSCRHDISAGLKASHTLSATDVEWLCNSLATRG